MPEDKKPIVIGIPKESFSDETRVAAVPDTVTLYKKAGFSILIEKDAGKTAGFPDSAYESKGATIKSREEVFSQADIMLHVRGYGANKEKGQADLKLYRKGQIALGYFDPLIQPELVKELAGSGVTAFAIELLPRITRAQGMDALSSMATIAGYKAVLLAADSLNKMFPMMMTAAGTIAPARAFVIGAGVAGLQAIASAKRLGAIVKAYDIRPAVKEQVESLGGKFVELDLETEKAEDKGGYAKAMDEDFYRKQRELMASVLKESDVVITTAAVPGKKAPTLITKEMVEVMARGSVIVDLAAEQGGNCELTKAGETINVNGVIIRGPKNIPAAIAYHASQMFARNLQSFIKNLVKDGEINLNMEDEIITETMITHDGRVQNARVEEALGQGKEEKQ